MNLALSTFMTTKSVQLVFMSLVMGLTAAYVYTLTEALTPEPSITYQNTTTHKNGTINAGSTQRDKAYVNSYLGGITLFHPFAAISLALLCVLTIVSAAPVSRCMWDNPITGPTVMICTLLVTPLWQCNYWFILTLGGIACLETAIGSPCTAPLVLKGAKPDSLTKIITVPGVWTMRITLQSAGLASRVLLFIPLVFSLDSTRTAPLVAACSFVGIPVFISAINIIRSVKTAWTDVRAESLLASEQESDSNPLVLPVAEVTTPQLAAFRYASAQPLRQSAFFTTEATLFRQTENSAKWNPKKTT